MSERKGFLIYRTFAVMFYSLSDEAAGKLIKAISQYALDQKQPDNLDGVLYGIFQLMKPAIDKNEQKYQNAIKRNAKKERGGVDPKGDKECEGFREMKDEANENQIESMVEANEEQKESMEEANEDQKESMVEANEEQKESKVEANGEQKKTREKPKQKLKDESREENVDGNEERREMREGHLRTPAHKAPPDLAEVKEYCKRTLCKVDPERFWYYCQAKGWMIDGNPIFDWQAMIKSWEKHPVYCKSGVADFPQTDMTDKIKEIEDLSINS